MTPSAHPPQVLFLCTGNYYRSRFAEIVFNHLAATRGLNAHAESRALARDPMRRNPGPISPYIEHALTARGIPFGTHHRKPKEATAADFEAADIVIALCRREHAPMVRERFPEQKKRVRYWDVEDVGLTDPPDALGSIAEQVAALVEQLADKDGSI